MQLSHTLLVIKLFILIRHITVVTFQITAVTLDLESFFFNFYDSTDTSYNNLTSVFFY